SPLPGRVDLTWTDNALTETRVEIAQDDSLGVVRSVGANVTQTTFTGLNPGVSYHFYVRACNTTGCSPWVGPAGKTPDGSDGVPVPAPPSNLSPTSPLPGRVDLTWTDNASTETRFEIAQDDSRRVVRSVGANVTQT